MVLIEHATSGDEFMISLVRQLVDDPGKNIVQLRVDASMALTPKLDSLPDPSDWLAPFDDALHQAADESASHRSSPPVAASMTATPSRRASTKPPPVRGIAAPTSCPTSKEPIRRARGRGGRPCPPGCRPRRARAPLRPSGGPRRGAPGRRVRARRSSGRSRLPPWQPEGSRSLRSAPAASEVQSLRVRIVSLLPSATDIIAELGLLDVLVGVSEDCNWPAEVSPSRSSRERGSTSRGARRRRDRRARARGRVGGPLALRARGRADRRAVARTS